MHLTLDQMGNYLPPETKDTVLDVGASTRAQFNPTSGTTTLISTTAQPTSTSSIITPTPSTSSIPASRTISTPAIVGILIGAVFGVLLLGLLSWCILRRRFQRKKREAAAKALQAKRLEDELRLKDERTTGIPVTEHVIRRPPTERTGASSLWEARSDKTELTPLGASRLRPMPSRPALRTANQIGSGAERIPIKESFASQGTTLLGSPTFGTMSPPTSLDSTVVGSGSISSNPSPSRTRSQQPIVTSTSAHSPIQPIPSASGVSEVYRDSHQARGRQLTQTRNTVANTQRSRTRPLALDAPLVDSMGVSYESASFVALPQTFVRARLIDIGPRHTSTPAHPLRSNPVQRDNSQDSPSIPGQIPQSSYSMPSLVRTLSSKKRDDPERTRAETDEEAHQATRKESQASLGSGVQTWVKTQIVKLPHERAISPLSNMSSLSPDLPAPPILESSQLLKTPPSKEIRRHSQPTPSKCEMDKYKRRGAIATTFNPANTSSTLTQLTSRTQPPIPVLAWPLRTDSLQEETFKLTSSTSVPVITATNASLSGSSNASSRPSRARQTFVSTPSQSAQSLFHTAPSTPAINDDEASPNRAEVQAQKDELLAQAAAILGSESTSASSSSSSTPSLPLTTSTTKARLTPAPLSPRRSIPTPQLSRPTQSRTLLAPPRPPASIVSASDAPTTFSRLNFSLPMTHPRTLAPSFRSPTSAAPTQVTGFTHGTQETSLASGEDPFGEEAKENRRRAVERQRGRRMRDLERAKLARERAEALGRELSED
ncbi:MAG: hypothetical protein M1824_000739 [Vezdaea acicularis]|nr:MAG: hypothetical protein M1824_000739 [Vezdaea acicularis]